MAYCIQFARFLEAEADIAKQGRLITIGQHTGPNPLLKISDAACDRMLRIGAELGLSAASRKRITKVRGATIAPAQRFLKRR
jgi:phage terminase small subunit